MSTPSTRPRLRLSVCCLGDVPARCLDAALAPWRGIADEVVVGVDDGIGTRNAEGLAALADRTIPVTLEQVETALDAVHAACSGDWVLRVHADEVPAVALLAELDAALGHATAQQWSIPRRSLYPDARHWLDEVPWWPDYQPRLFRNGTERHAPTAAGFTVGALYRLEFLRSNAEARFRKSLLFDVHRPEAYGPLGIPMHRYHMLEGHTRRAPAAVPEADHPAIDRLLRA